ncbi:isocitrate lyase/phosphoenolpyruvate mutase family protein [Aurantimonas aggregata]|uniref:Isocitrate lyase/phosphoenolpyruvate mutase family protein n=1 Tax=Aurantimonas aggregata TaxID=2047720 RepID=A0A6L9MK11_9HYPH|nr:isocitrate lyase/phosphoenolpyruvate mutase family protein [Aurantimonas aggregata]NDV87962.1 isocitrate lyase/phosphoenolpyruvate mutase family protein [Aurantimonas aggregata]
MTSITAKALAFRRLHVRGEPIVLYNIWDAGSAAVVARSGAKAIATGSWSVAAAQGYGDGEEMPLDDVLAVVRRVVRNVNVPVTVDFEGGYAVEPALVTENVRRLLQLNVVGLNLEDQVVNGLGLYSVREQVERLEAVRKAADDAGVPAFINARTDVFLKAEASIDHAALLDEALLREKAYAKAGADGFFVPGLADIVLVRKLCERASLPINVMAPDDPVRIREFVKLGVSRISLGPAPFFTMTADLERRARAAALAA